MRISMKRITVLNAHTLKSSNCNVMKSFFVLQNEIWLSLHTITWLLFWFSMHTFFLS